MKEQYEALLRIILSAITEEDKINQINDFIKDFQDKGNNLSELLNYQDSIDATLFHRIITQGNKKIINTLINDVLLKTPNINLNLQDHLNSNIILILALNANMPDIALKLINNGASPFIKNRDGKTPYDLAKEQGYNDILDLIHKTKEFAEYIKITEVENGVNQEALKESFLKIIKFNIVEALPNLRLYSSTLFKDVLKSIPNENKDNAVSVHLKNFIDTNKKKGLDLTLYIITKPKTPEASTYIQSVIADTWLNAEYTKGYTILTWAVSKGYIDIIPYLIKNGANPYLQDIHGKSIILDKAEKKGYDIENFLPIENLYVHKPQVIELANEEHMDEELPRTHLLNQHPNQSNLENSINDSKTDPLSKFDELKNDLKTKPLNTIDELNNNLNIANKQNISIGRKLLSYFVKIEEYKIYNELKDYIFIRTKTELDLGNKLSYRIKKALIELKTYEKIDEKTTLVILQKWKLEKYIGVNKEEFKESANDLKRSAAQERNIFGRAFYYIWTGPRELNNTKLALTSKIMDSEDCKNILRSKVNVIMGYEKPVIKDGKATYSDKKLHYANWNGYRNSSWANWAWSFVSSNITEYLNYNELKNHRKSAFKLLKNIHSLVQNEVETKLENRLEQGDTKFINANDDKTNQLFEAKNRDIKITDQNKSWVEKLKLSLPIYKWKESDIKNSRIKHAAKEITNELKQDSKYRTMWRNTISKMASNTHSHF